MLTSCGRGIFLELWPLALSPVRVDDVGQLRLFFSLEPREDENAIGILSRYRHDVSFSVGFVVKTFTENNNLYCLSSMV